MQLNSGQWGLDHGCDDLVKARIYEDSVFLDRLRQEKTIFLTCMRVTCRGLGAKTKPTASAPASTASWASSRLVLAQILVHMRLASTCKQYGFRFIGAGQQPLQGTARVFLPHQ